MLGEFIRDVRRVQIGKYEDVRLATQGRVRTFCLGHPRGDGRVGLEFAVDEEIGREASGYPNRLLNFVYSGMVRTPVRGKGKEGDLWFD